MRAFEKTRAVVAPLDRANVDTDQIIPKQFLRAIGKTGYGSFLFDQWRYLDRGEIGMDCARRPRNADFALNDSRYQGAGVLLARENFGCGSSREHAVWALAEAGFRVVIAPSFGEIFQANAMKNGLLPVVLPTAVVDRLFAAAREAAAEKPLEIEIDLRAQSVRAFNAAGENWRFEIEAEPKRRLLEGLDEIALTLRRKEEIVAFETRRRAAEPWAFL